MRTFDELEKLICDMISRAGSGHYASSMSALEIMYPLFYERGVKPDEFILSKGHAAPALYAILYDLGYLTEKDLEGFRKWGGLPGHPEIGTKGVLCSSGSLGMGISKALGLAHANPDKTYHVLVGDGELQEGQNWEAILYADSQKVKNIRVYVDVNYRQYSGYTRAVQHKWILPYFVSFIITRWRHDNSYLCKPKEKDMAYPLALFAEMEKDNRIIVLNADLEHDFGLTTIKNNFPDRYIQCGISEAHMVSMANGLALAGKIPICHTFSSFYKRAIDQIYNNVCDDLHIGYVAGLTDHGDVNIGKSHEPVFKDNLCLITGLSYATSTDRFFGDLMDFPGVYLEVP